MLKLHIPAEFAYQLNKANQGLEFEQDCAPMGESLSFDSRDL